MKNTTPLFAPFISTLSLLFFVACATNTGEQSAGIQSEENKERQYPRSHFLKAQGYGDSAQQAEENARLNLASIFSVRIRSDQRSYQNVSSLRTAGGEEVSVSYSLNNQVQQQTDQLIEGMEVITSPATESARYTSLAVLEKQPAIGRLQQQIGNLDQQTQHTLEAVNSRDTLGYVAKYYSAWQAQQLANSRRQQLSILQEFPANPSPWPAHTLKQKLLDRLQQLRLHTTHQIIEPWGRLIESGLAESGLRLLHDKNPEYLLSIEAHISDPFVRDKWYWQLADFSFLLRDVQGNERGGWNWTIKTSATQESLLHGRIKNDLEKYLKEKTLPELLEVAVQDIPKQ